MSAIGGLHSFSLERSVGKNPPVPLHYRNKKKFTSGRVHETKPHGIDLSRINFHLSIPPHLATNPQTVSAPASSQSGMGAEKTIHWMANFHRQAKQVFSNLNTIYRSNHPRISFLFDSSYGINLISSCLFLKSGIRNVKKAEKISDREGKKLAYVQIAQGIFFTFTGGLSILSFSLSFAITSGTAKVVTSIQKVFASLVGANLAAGTGCAALTSTIRLGEQSQFMKEYPSLEDLRKFLSITSEEREMLLKEMDPAIVQTPQKKEVGLQEKEALLLEKKETILKRVVGSRCLELIRGSDDEKAAAAIKAVWKERKVVSLVSLSQNLAGIGLTIYGYVYGAPVAVSVAVLQAARAVSQFFLDIYREIREV